MRDHKKKRIFYFTLILSQSNIITQTNFWPNMGGGGLEQAGASVAVDELLLQSHEGFLVLFPAWERGVSAASFKTLRARGAFLVTAAINEDGRVLSGVEIHSEAGVPCRLVAPWPTGMQVRTTSGTIVHAKATPMVGNVSTYVFETTPGETYILNPIMSL